jgi:hypothetical protein
MTLIFDGLNKKPSMIVDKASPKCPLDIFGIDMKLYKIPFLYFKVGNHAPTPTTPTQSNADKADKSGTIHNHKLGYQLLLLCSLIERYTYHCGWVPLRPVILTLARIGSPGPGRFPHSHCGSVPFRPSVRPQLEAWTREIPLLSLWLGAIEARDSDFSHYLETQDQEIPLLSMWLGAIVGQ